MLRIQEQVFGHWRQYSRSISARRKVRLLLRAWYSHRLLRRILREWAKSHLGRYYALRQTCAKLLECQMFWKWKRFRDYVQNAKTLERVVHQFRCRREVRHWQHSTLVKQKERHALALATAHFHSMISQSFIRRWWKHRNLGQQRRSQYRISTTRLMSRYWQTWIRTYVYTLDARAFAKYHRLLCAFEVWKQRSSRQRRHRIKMRHLRQRQNLVHWKSVTDQRTYQRGQDHEIEIQALTQRAFHTWHTSIVLQLYLEWKQRSRCQTYIRHWHRVFVPQIQHNKRLATLAQAFRDQQDVRTSVRVWTRQTVQQAEIRRLRLRQARRLTSGCWQQWQTYALQHVQYQVAISWSARHIYLRPTFRHWTKGFRSRLEHQAIVHQIETQMNISRLRRNIFSWSRIVSTRHHERELNFEAHEIAEARLVGSSFRHWHIFRVSRQTLKRNTKTLTRSRVQTFVQRWIVMTFLIATRAKAEEHKVRELQLLQHVRQWHGCVYERQRARALRRHTWVCQCSSVIAFWSRRFVPQRKAIRCWKRKSRLRQWIRGQQRLKRAREQSRLARLFRLAQGFRWWHLAQLSQREARKSKLWTMWKSWTKDRQKLFSRQPLVCFRMKYVRQWQRMTSTKRRLRQITCHFFLHQRWIRHVQRAKAQARHQKQTRVRMCVRMWKRKTEKMQQWERLDRLGRVCELHEQAYRAQALERARVGLRCWTIWKAWQDRQRRSALESGFGQWKQAWQVHLARSQYHARLLQRVWTRGWKLARVQRQVERRVFYICWQEWQRQVQALEQDRRHRMHQWQVWCLGKAIGVWKWTFVSERRATRQYQVTSCQRGLRRWYDHTTRQYITRSMAELASRLRHRHLQKRSWTSWQRARQERRAQRRVHLVLLNSMFSRWVHRRGFD